MDTTGSDHRTFVSTVSSATQCSNQYQYGCGLFVVTVPTNKLLFVGTVPTNKLLFVGTII